MAINTLSNGTPIHRLGLAVVAVLASAGLASGCSGSNTGTPSASGTASSTPVPASSAPAPPAPPSVPAPPAGAKALASRSGPAGGTFTRYETAQGPAAVVGYYESGLKTAGFSVTSTGGGGGGWGGSGGSGAGLTGNNGTTFVAVEAGGSNQGSTYFEVCAGTSNEQVSNCQDGNSDS